MKQLIPLPDAFLIHNSQILGATSKTDSLGTHCQNCNKLPHSMLEFNSVMLCADCFEKEIRRMASAIIEP